MKKTNIIATAIVGLLLAYSCAMSDTDEALKGKIVLDPVQDSICYIYNKLDCIKDSFRYRDDNNLSYGFFRWLNTKDSLICYQYVDRANYLTGHSNIVLFNLSGKLIDYIYKAENGEEALPLYPSRDDKYFLFTTQKKIDPSVSVTSIKSLVIMDLGKKEVVGKIDNIHAELKESPWLHTGYKFVYSKENHEYTYGIDTGSPGIYLYDLASRKPKLLIYGGRNAMVSPTTDEIAFEKDNSINVFDFKAEKARTVYEFGSKYHIFNMHCSPDGRNIYVIYQYGCLDMDCFAAILVEKNTGKTKSIKGNWIRPYDNYSWK